MIPRSSGMAPGQSGGTPRLAELVAALSLATDLGLGLPMEHVMRTCLISMRVGEHLGLSAEEQTELYYLAMLAWVGCMADSTETAAWFGDDIAFRADAAQADPAGLEMLWFLLRHVGPGSPLPSRVRLRAAFLASAGRELSQSMATNCQVTGQLAERLGLGGQLKRSLPQVFARWDGRGTPAGLQADEIARSVRIMRLADLAEMVHREHGADAAVDMVRSQRGRSLDPGLVDEFCAYAPELLAALGPESSWDAVIATAPGAGAPLTETELDEALEAIADFTDLKSIYFSGHSRAVAELAAAAARHAGFPGRDITTIRRAGLVHDLGRGGVPNTIWDKPGPLTVAEWERVRMHVYYTERILARIPGLSRPAAIAAMHHERLDCSGYHRGLCGAAIGASGRLLAAADSYQAMTQPRPYRPALPEEQAASALRAEVRAGHLAGDAVEAVLHAAGHRPVRRRAAPAGLTAREIEVLVMLARGASNREMARSLSISAKTVGNHVEHIYTKIGASTRPAATLFAMSHGLLDHPIENPRSQR